MSKTDLMEKIVSLCKRRGFIFPSSEIYGGLSSTYDYGPLGVELKNNIKKIWWRAMVQEQVLSNGRQAEIVGLDSAILMSPKVWQASGHLSSGFTDNLQECKACHERFRVTSGGKGQKKCPNCGGELTKPRKFNLMMKTYLGTIEDESTITYLRGETAQGIYVNYENVYQSQRLKIPFGIAQIGKAFRNEITPGNFTFRTREFEQMEMQYFVKPGETAEYFQLWQQARFNWYLDYGLKKNKLRFREHKKDELAHYAQKAVDIEYEFPWGFAELAGIHDRGDWDLSNHQKHSGKDLTYRDEATGEKFIPHIVETSDGVDRATLTFLIESYEAVQGGRTTTTEATKEEEVVLRLHKDLAPIKVAILPLSRKPKLQKVAQKIQTELQKHWLVQYDETGSIGRRYRRQDEIGTPYCLTVDFKTLEDQAVTLRDRDTMEQQRVKIGELVARLKEYFHD